MILKVAPIFLMALLVGADKKIELQDIEEDNLKSEKSKDFDQHDPRSQSSGSEQGQSVPLEFLKSGIFRFFENPTHAPQQQRYVHQYAVTEQPERSSVVTPKATYGPPAAQQAMVGYLSNVPMQIYLVPQYYNDQHGPVSNQAPSAPYSAPSVARVAGYQTSPEAVQTQTNYIEVPSYVTPTGQTYVQQYTPPVTYVSYPQPTVAPPQPTVAPVLTYQMPVVQYPTAIVQAAPTSASKTFYQSPQYTETNTIEEVHEHEEESPKQYSTHTEVTYTKAPSSNDYTRFHPGRMPHEYRHSSISELPPPNPLLLKTPPHLSHIPKTLPIYHRPMTKPVYSTGIGHGGFSHRPNEAYSPPFKRRPTSLLDSYIPSSVQIEYLKRGFARDPLEAYEALSSGRHLSHSAPPTRHFERGFLPNQMYHTGAGGVTYGHYKRASKIDRPSQN